MLHRMLCLDRIMGRWSIS